MWLNSLKRTWHLLQFLHITKDPEMKSPLSPIRANPFKSIEPNIIPTRLLDLPHMSSVKQKK